METFQFIHFTALLLLECITALLELVSKQWIVNLPSCNHLAMTSPTTARHLLRFSLQPQVLKPRQLSSIASVNGHSLRRWPGVAKEATATAVASLCLGLFSICLNLLR
jgi:hypothetical protein